MTRHLLRLLRSAHIRRTTPHASTAARHFSSETIDPFASLKCYTRCDADTPYFVLEPPAVEVRERAAPPDELLAQWSIQHLVSKSLRGTCHVYLVGVGCDEKSVEGIKGIVDYLKPEVLFLELCASRRMALALEKVQGNKWIQVQHRVACVAFEKATRNGAKVILGDRPFNITVRRILEGMLAMRIWEFTRLSFFLLFQFIDYGKDNRSFNINDFIRQKLKDLLVFPTLLQPVIHERDLYMCSVLAKVAEEHSSVVAVVGTDHVNGIKKNWDEISQVQAHVPEKSD